MSRGGGGATGGEGVAVSITTAATHLRHAAPLHTPRNHHCELQCSLFTQSEVEVGVRDRREVG
ncbi:hypothetical protein E2C01_078696 [Portunus trituberculatus]|uniref:Uncharacterized protein n=1 Tax=Portunus trituberculatus TaxID=210409 RepID=A0A5B7IJH5_PORTR|nr:hypothetical protein [Portunus trituberculatus]